MALFAALPVVIVLEGCVQPVAGLLMAFLGSMRLHSQLALPAHALF